MTAVAPNPAVRALEAIVHALANVPGVDVGALRVEPNLAGVPAEFRLTVRAPDGRPDVDGCNALAAALEAAPGIARVAVSPPNVYVSPATGLLAEVVPAAATEDRAGFGHAVPPEARFYIVSCSGPNVNKPLHLGHLRNNFIGMAVANLLADAGHTVDRQAPHCDWGIHIAQALLAWRKWGEGRTPESTGVKGDHFVGRHYVLFHERITPSLEAEASALMQAMEDGDEELRAENHRFTRWADAGVRETYARIGTHLDAVFYDSDYLEEGKQLIADGLRDGRCLRRDDTSIYIDLTEHDLGEVTLVRKDGTPTVYRQWMAVNIARYPSRPFDQIYVVTGKEWVAGIRILRETLCALGQTWAARMEGAHYGLVVLEQGRMKSRQGTGVAADALLDQVRDHLLKAWADSGTDLDSVDTAAVCETLAVALVKYLFLRAKRSRDVVFSEAAMWDDALPHLAAAVRTLRWAADASTSGFWARSSPYSGLSAPKTDEGEAERPLLLAINRFPNVVDRATAELEPAHLVRYVDEVASLVASLPVPPSAATRTATAIVLRRSFALLNIDLPPSLDQLPSPFSQEVPHVREEA